MSGAIVAPDRYYFRSVPRVESGDPRYAWLMEVMLLGSGARTKDRVIIDLYAVR